VEEDLLEEQLVKEDLLEEQLVELVKNVILSKSSTLEA
jgi:hypothetical protein